MARSAPQTDRLVALVEILASHPGESLTLAEVTRRLGVNKSSCHAMLTALVASGWLLRDERRKAYRLGPALVRIGRVAAQGFPALEFARPVMVELSRQTGALCIALSVEGDVANVVEQVRDLRAAAAEIRAGTIALRAPLGAAVLAWRDVAAIDAWLSQVPGEQRASYRAALEATRRRGFAVELATAPEARLRRLVEELNEDLSSPGGGRPQPPLRELAARLASELVDYDDFLPVSLEPDRQYVASTVGAPVFDGVGEVVLVLSLMGFTEPMSGSALMQIGRDLSAATAALTVAILGRRPDPIPAEPPGRAR